MRRNLFLLAIAFALSLCGCTPAPRTPYQLHFDAAMQEVTDSVPEGILIINLSDVNPRPDRKVSRQQHCEVVFADGNRLTDSWQVSENDTAVSTFIQRDYPGTADGVHWTQWGLGGDDELSQASLEPTLKSIKKCLKEGKLVDRHHPVSETTTG